MSFRDTASGPEIDKDPDDALDYVIDMSGWLPSADTLSSVTASVVDGDVTITQQAVATQDLDVAERYGSRTIPAQRAAVVWLSGGTVGTTSSVRARLTTQQGRQRDVTFLVRVVER